MAKKGSSEKIRDAKADLIEFDNILETADRASSLWIRSQGFSDTEFWIVYELYSNEAPVTQGRICEAWSLSRQTVNSAVKRLQQRGVVSLEPLPGNKRDKLIVLAEPGCSDAVAVVERYIAHEHAAMDVLDDGERTLCLSLMRRLADALASELAHSDEPQ